MIDERTSVESVARAILYEGLSLYPYRSTSIKNQKRVLFGSLLPPAWAAARGEGDATRAACTVLVIGPGDVDVSLRFLRLEGDEVHEHVVDGARAFRIAGLEGVVEARFERTDVPDVRRLAVSVTSTTHVAVDLTRADVERYALSAAHFVLRARGGASFASLLDPPEALASVAASCAQEGLYPVLAGADTMLASPIVLYDHPRVAPESRGDLFDATEIEEILSLRVRTLTDDERREIREGSPAAARLLERVESLGPQDLARLHGALRRSEVAVGARVTLRPKGRADALDVVLGGMAATVVSIEETVEGESLYCVTIDRDPGKDLGEQGFPGHRFFFRREELEP